jgi:hypothetical protein
MRVLGLRPWRWAAVLLPVALWLAFEGCQTLTNKITKPFLNGLGKWSMLGQEALDDPLKAVGGDGVVFAPCKSDHPWNKPRLAAATPEELVAYFAPVFVQQRVNTHEQRYPYPPEYDEIGTACLKRGDKGKLKACVSGHPRIYAIYQKVLICGHEHVQLTYTAWYPAHPRMKAFDLEEADIDSCVVRVTLDEHHAPVFYETIAACGCFHKVFVKRCVEEAAAKAFGPAEPGKKFAVEKTIKDGIDWEVAGVVDEPPDEPRRPVVFVKAGDHKVLGMGSASRLRVPPQADQRPYELADYAELYSVPVAGEAEPAPFFDLGKGGKVWGAQRKERFIFAALGVDGAGQPRANNQIKMHFDQSTWGDPTIYERCLRLPPGTL